MSSGLRKGAKGEGRGARGEGRGARGEGRGVNSGTEVPVLDGDTYTG
ncbi:MAG: hypothetical protein GX937_07675 [Lentisphaerae bacterium]|nr:hypothetical protein [Lentisphaerota bacterium]